MASLNRDIVRLAIPNILSNLSVPLLGIVDTILVGHMEGVVFLGAVAIGGIIFDSLYWSFGFLRMGTTGLTAQAYGSQQPQEMANILGRSLLVAGGLALGLLLLQIPIALLSFYLIDASPEVEALAHSYFNIRIWAAPATLSLFAFHGWFLGMQNVKFPLYLTILVNASNIGFSLLFIKGLHFHSDGVAWGTLCAQYLGMGFAIVIVVTQYKETIRLLNLQLIFAFDTFKRFLHVNFDIFVRTLCLVGVFAFFTAKSAEYGNTVLAANSILLHLWSIASFGIDGFAFAGESLVGRFIGEQRRAPLYQVIGKLFIWVLSLGGMIACAYFLFMREILAIFTDQSAVIETAFLFQWWTILTPLVSGFCYMWDGVFIGATESKPLRNSMLICTFLIFFPLFYGFSTILSNHSLWLALLSFMLFRGITLSIAAYYRVPRWVPKS